ncbi:hypothetical protein BpHYR1_020372 [Brachionus plicatilis]|uniref:Uncharacterized protein n=1 Tax=Brachionus plicatilis TaxID=10195 RepID=A0A3M7R7J6_BRAPC|nr:hypothetical protein BpHYR1_020372 [Brachionus plicatilis]
MNVSETFNNQYFEVLNFFSKLPIFMGKPDGNCRNCLMPLNQQWAKFARAKKADNFHTAIAWH